MQRDWRRAGVELALNEVMAEPIVHLVMRRDGLTPEEVWAVVEEVRRQQAEAPASPAATTVDGENQNAPRSPVIGRRGSRRPGRSDCRNHRVC